MKLDELLFCVTNESTIVSRWFIVNRGACYIRIDNDICDAPRVVIIRAEKDMPGVVHDLLTAVCFVHQGTYDIPSLLAPQERGYWDFIAEQIEIETLNSMSAQKYTVPWSEALRAIGIDYSGE